MDDDEGVGRSGSKPSFTITRNADALPAATSSGRVIVTANRSGAGGRAVTKVAIGAPAQKPSSFVIEAGGGARQVKQGQKRRSGEMSPPTGNGSLTRVVLNENARMEDEDEEPAAATLKRTKFVIENSASNRSGAGDSRGRGTTVLVNAAPRSVAGTGTGLRIGVSNDEGQSVAASSIVPTAAPLPGVGTVRTAPAPTRLPTKSAPSTSAAAAVASPTAAAPVAAVPGSTVLLRNLSPSVTAKFILTHLFAPFDVLRVTLDTNEETGACNGTAEAQFASAQAANEAVALCHNQQLLGSPVKLSIISFSETKKELAASGAVAASSGPPAQTLFSQPPLPFAHPSTGGVRVNVSSLSSAPRVSGTTQVAASGNPFSVGSTLTNVGFMWEASDAAEFRNDPLGETVFNITNLKGVQSAETAQTVVRQPRTVVPVSARASGDSPVTSAGTGAAGKKPLQLSVRPKSVVLSGAQALAGTNRDPAADTGRPAITLSKNAFGR